MPVERELLGSGFELTLGGSSSILAHNLAVPGSRVAFATLVGDDEIGRIALDRLRDSGLHLLQIPQKKGSGTGVTTPSCRRQLQRRFSTLLPPRE